jgi:hypothetical protein
MPKRSLDDAKLKRKILKNNDKQSQRSDSQPKIGGRLSVNTANQQIN